MESKEELDELRRIQLLETVKDQLFTWAKRRLGLGLLLATMVVVGGYLDFRSRVSSKIEDANNKLEQMVADSSTRLDRIARDAHATLEETIDQTVDDLLAERTAFLQQHVQTAETDVRAALVQLGIQTELAVRATDAANSAATQATSIASTVQDNLGDLDHALQQMKAVTSALDATVAGVRENLLVLQNEVGRVRTSISDLGASVADARLGVPAIFAAHYQVEGTESDAASTIVMRGQNFGEEPGRIVLGGQAETRMGAGDWDIVDKAEVPRSAIAVWEDTRIVFSTSFGFGRVRVEDKKSRRSDWAEVRRLSSAGTTCPGPNCL